MQLRSSEIVGIPDKGVLYLKKWQSNGFYPVEKAIYTNGEWHIHWGATNGWSQAFLSYTRNSFLFLLQNNLFLITDFPMENTEKFNFE